MKIWVKFNAGFQLCPPDLNFAPPPRSREAGDAAGLGPVPPALVKFCTFLTKIA